MSDSAFHLGSEISSSSPCLYPSRDLVTHAVVLGMTGSGKTGLGCVLLEEAALAGVPIIAVDPKGDLANLALAFPQLRPEDFAPFAPPGDDPTAIAQRAREGLAATGVEPERLSRFAAIPREIWSPGSRVARPMSLLPPLAPPRTDEEGTRDRAIATTSALLSIAGVEGDPVRSPEHALVSHVLLDAWRSGRTLDLPSLLRTIQSPPFDRLGAMDLDSVVPARARQELAVRVNSALASPAMAGMLDGETLDVQRLLTGADGRPRVSVLSIAHLGDAERAFFVTILLGEVVAWMRAQEGTPSLRAILYMDEIAGYFPPVATPPTKAPMLMLLKQARAFGLGIVLATQNPVDLDYKGLSNCGTWMIGRLQTERDKLRVLDGLEGLSAGGLDRGSIDQLLSRLEPRTFLLHDVHAPAPRTFRTRWALSYLRGPLSREHLKKLAPLSPAPVPAAAPSPSSRPVLPASIRESFVLRPDVTAIAYRPGLSIRVSVHYVDARSGLDTYVDSAILAPMGDEGPRWTDAWWMREPLPESPEPLAGIPFAPLPAIATRDKSYSTWAKDVVAHVVKERPLVLWHAPDLDLIGAPGETREQLLARASEAASRATDAARRELDAKWSSKLAKARTAVDGAQRRHDAASTTGNIDYLDAGAGVLSALTGGRRSIGAAARKGARARERSERARIQLDAARSTLARLEEEHAAARRAIDDDHGAARARLEEKRIPAKKTEVRVERLALVWVPSPG